MMRPRLVFAAMLITVGLRGALTLAQEGGRAGTIHLGKFETTAVATVANPEKYEKLAAGELIAYLERMTGRWLEGLELDSNTLPQGVIAVGSLAKKAGLVTADELQPLARDGYDRRVHGGLLRPRGPAGAGILRLDAPRDRPAPGPSELRK